MIVKKRLKLFFQNLRKNQIRCFLSEENDSRNIFIEIHAGAGGTESQDWASMLRRMYLKNGLIKKAIIMN